MTRALRMTDTTSHPLSCYEVPVLPHSVRLRLRRLGRDVFARPGRGAFRRALAALPASRAHPLRQPLSSGRRRGLLSLLRGVPLLPDSARTMTRPLPEDQGRRFQHHRNLRAVELARTRPALRPRRFFQDRSLRVRGLAEDGARPRACAKRSMAPSSARRKSLPIRTGHQASPRCRSCRLENTRRSSFKTARSPTTAPMPRITRRRRA